MTANGNRLFACEELDQDDCGKGDYRHRDGLLQEAGLCRRRDFDVDSKKVKAETLDGRFCSKNECRCSRDQLHNSNPLSSRPPGVTARTFARLLAPFTGLCWGSPMSCCMLTHGDAWSGGHLGLGAAPVHCRHCGPVFRTEFATSAAHAEARPNQTWQGSIRWTRPGTMSLLHRSYAMQIGRT